MSKKVHMKERLYSLRHFEKKDFNWAFSKFGSKNWIGFFYVTQRIELFSLIWLTELTLFCMILRIELFSLIWLTELTLFLYDSQNWTFWNMTRWNEPFFFFQIWLKELFFFLYKKGSILWNISEKKLIPLSSIREFQFFESNSKKKVQCQKKVIFK